MPRSYSCTSEIYSELLELYSSNGVLLIVGCAGGTDVSVVYEQREVEVGGLFGDGEDGHPVAPGASADRRVCAVLKKQSNFNCLPP